MYTFGLNEALETFQETIDNSGGKRLNNLFLMLCQQAERNQSYDLAKYFENTPSADKAILCLPALVVDWILIFC